MKKGLYSVYDEKACFFGSPFLAANDGDAIRSFSDAVNSGGSLISAHPEDFVLYDLGDYDDSTACVTVHTAPLPLTKGSALKAGVSVENS